MYSKFSYINNVANFNAVGNAAVDSLTALGGRAFGSKWGSRVGAGAGGLSGALYNPDMIDPNTGQTKKMGILGRAGMIAGGAAVGGGAGAALGTGIGHVAGRMMPKNTALQQLGETAVAARNTAQNVPSLDLAQANQTIREQKKAARTARRKKQNTGQQAAAQQPGQVYTMPAAQKPVQQNMVANNQLFGLPNDNQRRNFWG